MILHIGLVDVHEVLNAPIVILVVVSFLDSVHKVINDANLLLGPVLFTLQLLFQLLHLLLLRLFVPKHTRERLLLVVEAALQLQQVLLERLDLLLLGLKRCLHLLRSMREYLLGQLELLDLTLERKQLLHLVLQVRLDLTLLRLQLLGFFSFGLPLQFTLFLLVVRPIRYLNVMVRFTFLARRLHFDRLNVLLDRVNDIVELFNFLLVCGAEILDLTRLIILLLRQLFFVLHFSSISLSL